MSEYDETLARIKARLDYQVDACDKASELINGIESTDRDTVKRVRNVLVEIAGLKAISERKLTENKFAEKMFRKADDLAHTFRSADSISKLWESDSE